ncbi:MAG: hypothetical protein V2A79_07035 [Planctomycetota bacterium]
MVVYVAFYFLIDANALRYPYLLTPEHNSNVAEAAAILHGRLELEFRTQDTALFEGKAYNVYPPMFTLISLVALKWSPEGVHLQVLFLLTVPLPALAYLLFRRRTKPVWLAVVLTLGYLFGTSMLPVVNQALAKGDTYHVDHLLSQIGLLIFLLDYFGRRRIWLGGIGLVIAAWSRQLTAAYLIPLVFAAVAGRNGAARWYRTGLAVLCAAVMAALPMTLNTLKFGNPLDTGYRYVYAGLGTPFADKTKRSGLFSLRYLPRNFYYMNLGFPTPESVNGIVRFKANPSGTGIWWTTPLLLYLWVEVRRLWADGALRWLLVSAAIVVAGVLLYHATGWLQWGYNRFSLDYLVVLLAVLAPGCDGLRRRVLTPVFTAWSLWYFRWAI